MRVLVAVVLASGCATALDSTPHTGEPQPYTDENGERVPQAGTATLRETTFILPAAVSQQMTVHFDHLLVPAAGNEDLLALPPNTVLVSGTGDGFLRKLYSATLESDTIRIVTGRATLADAVTDATFHATTTELLDVVQRIDSRATAIDATIIGRASFTPTIDVDFVLADGALQTFDLRVTGNGTARIEGAVAYAGATHWAWGDESPWEKQQFRRVYALGPLPIVVIGRASSTLAAQAYVEEPVAFTDGISTSLTVDAESHFVPPSAWTSSDASTHAVAQIGPTHDGTGRASLAVGITPRIELAFYGLTGPRLELAAQVGGFGGYCGSSLQTGLQAALIGGATMRLETLAKMSDQNVVLFDKRMPLDELEQCAP